MFEIHLTVNPLKQEDIPQFVKFCQSIDVKPIIIELSQGETAQQPMISKVLKDVEPGTLKDRIDQLSQLFIKEGYEIRRVKVEVPIDQTESASEFPEYKKRYFEWHGKVAFTSIEELIKKTKHLRVHLSKNSIKDEPNQRFLTYRKYTYNKDFFLPTIEGIRNEIIKQGYNFTKEEFEFCIYDSNIGIDKGWMDDSRLTDWEHIRLLGFEAFLRRASKREEKFILKGSLLMRQCISNKHQRVVNDLDFIYGNFIDKDEDAGELFTNWVTEITETHLNGSVSFESFSKNAFWRGIDYAMKDDFPTTNTEIDFIFGGVPKLLYDIDLDISWNLPLDEEPVPLLYHPLEGEPFIVPYTIPVTLQISWKLHQSIIRPRAKDFLDIILLIRDNELDEKAIERIAINFISECRKDQVDPKRLILYQKGTISDYFKNYKKATYNETEYIQHHDFHNIIISNNLNLSYLENYFKLDHGFETEFDMIKKFEETINHFGIPSKVLELS